MIARRLARSAFLSALLLPFSLFFPLGLAAGEVRMQFFGNQHFRLVSPAGKVVLINPWVKGNADAPIAVDFYKRGEVHLIVATAGHGDDQGDAVEIAARTGARLIAVSELGQWMEGQIGKFGGKREQVVRMGLGGRRTFEGITVQVLLSHHGSGIASPGAPAPLYGGPAAGYLITFEDGLRVYMAGSTALTLDIQLFGMRYKPHIAMLPVMGNFMMHPDDAAFAAKLLMTDNPNLKTLIPQHTRFKQRAPWMGTPEQFEAEVRKLGLPLQVLKPAIGMTYTLTK